MDEMSRSSVSFSPQDPVLEKKKIYCMIPYGASDPSFTMESKLGHKRVDVFRAFINDFKNVL